MKLFTLNKHGEIRLESEMEIYQTDVLFQPFQLLSLAKDH